MVAGIASGFTLIRSRRIGRGRRGIKGTEVVRRHECSDQKAARGHADLDDALAIRRVLSGRWHGAT
ncbi:MAG: hypothetical protein ACK4WH_15940, partial [Phycisphaerales bacterium]